MFSVIHEADEKLVRSTGETDSLGEWIMIEKWVRYLYVTVEGERPAVDGWNFIATIDHTEASADEAGNVTGNLIKSVPGAGEIPVSYRSARPICDHCKSIAGGTRPTSSARATSPSRSGRTAWRTSSRARAPPTWPSSSPGGPKPPRSCPGAATRRAWAAVGVRAASASRACSRRPRPRSRRSAG